MQQRKDVPKRIPASDLETLKTEKKLIVDAIKIDSYQVETELLGMLPGSTPGRRTRAGRSFMPRSSRPHGWRWPMANCA